MPTLYIVLLLLFIILLFIGLGLYFRKPAVVHKNIRDGQYFNSSYGKLFYSNLGNKKKRKVLLLHGIGASGFCWRNLVSELKEDCDLINLDLWGFGRSEKDPLQSVDIELHCKVILEFMDSLKIKKFHIIGCSMGGAIALWISNHYPKRVVSVVALAPAAHPKILPPMVDKLTWLSNLSPIVIHRKTIQTLLNNLYADSSLVTPEVIDGYLKPYLDKKAHSTFANHLVVIKDPRIFESLKGITVPTLVLWGQNDRLVSRKYMESIVKQIPLAQYSVHTNGGHHLMEEDPDWCRDKILPFFQA